MKKLMITLLTLSLLFLSACSTPNPPEDDPRTAIASDKRTEGQSLYQTDSKIILNEEKVPNEDPEELLTSDSNEKAEDPSLFTEPAGAEFSTSSFTQTSMVAEIDPMPSSSTSEQDKDISQQSQQESEKPAELIVPAQSSTLDATSDAEDPESVPEPEAESETQGSESAFDIDQWVAFARSYGQQIGLEYDSGATDCWDNPIIASPNSIYLERDITSRLNRYAQKGMTTFCVWAELRTDGRYDIYIGYA